MRELVENRPITSGGKIGTPVDLINVRKAIINTNFGGGKTLQEITFGFISQVPDVSGWKNDWISTNNFVNSPENEPAIHSVGAIIEVSYAHQFAVKQLAERVCAEELQLTSDPYAHFFPKYSPDGNWIAYHRCLPNIGFQFFKIKTKDGEKIQIADFEHSKCIAVVSRWKCDNLYGYDLNHSL